jgi:hypothetical protein
VPTIDAVLARIATQVKAGLLAATKRLDGRSRTARHIKQLVSSYSTRLGDVATEPTVAADIRRLGELEALCASYGSAALHRDPGADLSVVVRLEGVCRRLRRTLGLDNTPTSEAPLPSLQELGLE